MSERPKAHLPLAVLLVLGLLAGPVGSPSAAASTEPAVPLQPARGAADGPTPHFGFGRVLGQTTGTPTPTVTETTTVTPVATGTPIGGTGIVPTTQNVPPTSGVTAVACTSTLGQTCTVTGNVAGTFTITGSTSFGLVATAPSSAFVDGYPAVFIPTTYGVEAFQCGAVTSAFQTTCTGVTIGNPLQGATITVRFPLVGGSTSDVVGTVNLGVTATPTSLPLSTALSLVAASGQTGLPCGAVVGATCITSGSVYGTGTVTASMSWALTATVPSGVPVGTVPTGVFTTTSGREAFGCAAVTGATTVTCTGSTTGNALQGSNATVVFTAALTTVGTITGNAANVGLVAGGVPPPLFPIHAGLVGPLPGGGAPLLGGPFDGGQGAPFGAAPMAANLGVPRGPMAGLPVIPEADAIWLLVAGLATVGVAAWWRARRRGEAVRRSPQDAASERHGG